MTLKGDVIEPALDSVTCKRSRFTRPDHQNGQHVCDVFFNLFDTYRYSLQA